MPFSQTQRQHLSSKLKHKHVKTRRTPDAVLAYIEGWHAIAEANRIFGHDAWDRQNIAAECVWAKEQGNRFSCFYTAKVHASPL